VSKGSTHPVGHDRFVVVDIKDTDEIVAVAEGEIVVVALEEIVAVALGETVVDADEDRVGNEERAVGDVDVVVLDKAEDDTVIEGVKLEDGYCEVVEVAVGDDDKVADCEPVKLADIDKLDNGDCDDFVLPVDVLDNVADREPVELAVIDGVVVEECVILDEAVDDEVGVTETEIVVESVALEDAEDELVDDMDEDFVATAVSVAEMDSKGIISV